MDFLDVINQSLTEMLGPFGPMIAIGVLGLFMVLLAIPVMMNQREDPLKKLQRDIKGEAKKTEKKERLRQRGRNEKLDKFATFLEPQGEEELSAMQLKLRQAGYQSKDAVRFFHFAQMALGLIGLGLGAIYLFVLGNAEGMSQQRSVRMGVPDFLRLLKAFNKVGIMFSGMK